MNCHDRHIAGRNGFTLVELLIYMLLLGIVMTSIYSVFISNSKAHKSQQNTLAMVQDLRGSVDIMLREIRMAGCDPEEAGGMGFIHTPLGISSGENEDTDSGSIHFTMDVVNTNGASSESDGLSDGPNENIVYYFNASDNTIRRIARRSDTLALGSSIVAEKISGLQFTYLDSAGSTLTIDNGVGNTGDIRTVQISVTGETEDIDPNTLQKKTRVINTRIKIRNAGL